MKLNFFKAVFFLTAIFSLSSAADLVSDVKCQQRWPWSLAVDFNYTITKTTAKTTPVYRVYFSLESPSGAFDTLTLYPNPNDFEGDGATGLILDDGQKKTTWKNTSACEFSGDLADAVLKVHVEDVTDQANYLKLDLETFRLTTSTVGPDVSSNAPSKYAELWLKRIEPGTFIMGSATNEPGRVTTSNREAEHRVTITKAYYIGVFELTAGQYNRINENGTSTAVTPQGSLTYDALRGTNYGATWPVPNDHRVDAASFFGKLRAKTGKNLIFDLPTEAQWEMAARWKGTTGHGTNDYYGSCYWNNGVKFDSSYNGITDVAWGVLNSGGTCHEVGLKEASTSGLYDMHGNHSELVLDWMLAYSTSDVIDPEGPIRGVTRVLRGGNFYLNAGFCRMAFRIYNQPYESEDIQGCRVALQP